MNIWEMTDTGLVRKSNQDAYAVNVLADLHETLCVVCDGMGGTAGGQVASQLAVATFVTEMTQGLKAGMSPEEICQMGMQAVGQANAAVHQAALEKEEYRNMGTTLVATLVYPDGAVIWNVGDSRAYHVNEAGITRVSKDHSLVEIMVEHGEITYEQARTHPKRNLITRALGPDEVVDCDGFFRKVEPGEFLLLCSDGLVDTVRDEEILFEIIRNADQDSCLERLFAIAKQHGAPDNVTAVLLQQT